MKSVPEILDKMADAVTRVSPKTEVQSSEETGAQGQEKGEGLTRMIPRTRITRATLELKVIACNFASPTQVAATGALCFVLNANPGSGGDRVKILIRSRGHRWVEKWETAKRLINFRLKTIPESHPAYPKLANAAHPDSLPMLMAAFERSRTR